MNLHPLLSILDPAVQSATRFFGKPRDVVLAGGGAGFGRQQFMDKTGR
ncbi:hypothetical protein [Pseudomonas fluorescens]|jgi:hypothetical protein|nr:hypothetical protein [Pseudomonas fluorescens]